MKNSEVFLHEELPVFYILRWLNGQHERSDLSKNLRHDLFTYELLLSKQKHHIL